MGQTIAFVLRVAVSRFRSEKAVEVPAMAGRRRRGMATWLGKDSSNAEDGVSTASVLRDSSRRFLSRHGGRLVGGGRSDSPLNPSAVVVRVGSPRPSRSEMSSESPVRLNVLSRDFDSPVPRSPGPRVRSDREGWLAADCCPRCSSVPLWLRRRRAVISLAVIVSITVGIGGPLIWL